MKKCPFCAEEIQDEAIKCRYCEANLAVKISKVIPGSLADKIKLQKDDVLLSINGKVTPSLKTVNNIKEKIDVDRPFNMKILRDGMPLSLEASFLDKKFFGLEFYNNQKSTLQKNNEVNCPRCGSAQFSERKKYGAGKAIGGLLLAGPIGLFGGVMGKRPIILTCLKCGHSWQVSSK